MYSVRRFTYFGRRYTYLREALYLFERGVILISGGVILISGGVILIISITGGGRPPQRRSTGGPGKYQLVLSRGHLAQPSPYRLRWRPAAERPLRPDPGSREHLWALAPGIRPMVERGRTHRG